MTIEVTRKDLEHAFDELIAAARRVEQIAAVVLCNRNPKCSKCLLDCSAVDGFDCRLRMCDHLAWTKRLTLKELDKK